MCVDTTTLNGDAPTPGTGTWTLLSGNGDIDNSTLATTIVRNLGQGSNVFQWTITKNGCTNSATVTITNNIPSDAVITGPSVTESCDGSVTLTANHPTPYYADNQYWQQISGSGMTNTSTDFTITVNNLAPGNNVFTWTVENGSCSLTDSITITNNQVIAQAGLDDTICESSTYLNATDPSVIYPNQGTGHWTNLSGPQSWIVNSTLTNTQVVNLPNGTSSFQWTVEQGSCEASDIVQITNMSVTAVASDITECDGDITLNGNDPSTFGGSGLWKIIAGTGTLTDPTLYNTTITGISNGNSTSLQWAVYNSRCSDSTQITVTNNGFIISAGHNDTLCVDTAQLNAESPGTGTGVWTFVSGSATFDNSTNYQSIVRNLGFGENVLQWKVTKNGCSDSATVKIINNSPSPAVITGPLNNESCDGTVALTATTPVNGVGHWLQIAGSGLIGTSTPNSITVSGLSPNNNIFTWTVENWRCSSVDTITIINNQVISEAGNDDTICGADAYLNAVNPSTTIYGGIGHWVNLSGGSVTIDNSTSYYTAVHNLPQYSTVTFQWVVEKGTCQTTDNVSLTNYGVNAVASDNVACDSVITLTANAYIHPPENGYWTIGSPNTATFIDNPTSYNCQVSGLSSGGNQFVWHLSNGVCSDSTTIFITNNSFTVNADANGDVVNVCNDTYTLSADNPSPGSGYWTKVSGPGLVTNPSLYNSEVTNLGSTATILVWNVTKNGCSATDQVSIINNEVTASASDHLYTCDGTVTLDGNNPSPGTGVWKKVVPGSSGVIVNPTSHNTQVTNIDNETTVALTWTVYSSTGGCADSVTVYATNNNFDLSAGLNDTTCSDTITLAADDASPGTGYWGIAAGNGVFDNSTSNSTVVRNIGSGDNVYTWTVTKNGCSNTAQVTITNNSVTANAGFDQLDLCVDNATLNGNDPTSFGGSGYWTLVAGGGDITNSTNNITTVTNLSRNDNTFRWTVTANGCSDFDDVVIRNNSFDVEAGMSRTVCADTAKLKATVVSGGVGTWSPQGGTPATIDDNTFYNTIVRNLQQGTNTFRWTVSRDGCTFYDDVVITNDLPNPPVLVSSDTIVCVDSVLLQAVAPEPGATGLWTYTGSGGNIVNPSNNNTVANNLNPGTTVFIWTVKHNSCSLDTSFSVTNDGVTANAGGDLTGLCQDYTSLGAVNPTSPATGWWTKADAQPSVIVNSTSNVSDVTNLGYGENKFVWNVQKGSCSATDTVVIINNSASPAEVGNVPPSCDGTAILSATPPVYGSGYWSYIGTYPVVIVNSTNSNTQVQNLEYGANLFKWTVVNTTPYATCTSDTTFTVVNNEFTISAGNDQILCDSVTHLEAETRPNADTAYWTVITGSPVISNTNDPNSQIIVGEGQSTVLQWTVRENGCSDDDYVTIQNKGVTAIAYDDEVCDSTATLSAVPPTSGNSGYWTSANPGVTFSPDNSQYNANVSGLNQGANLFTWHIYNSYCSDSTTINVNYLVPYADAGPSVPVCDDYVTLSANDPSTYGGTGQWSVAIGNGDFVNSTLHNTVVNNLGQGANTLRWTVTLRGCSNSDDVVITNNKPSISVGATQNICNDYTTLTGNQPDPGDSGLWTVITPGTFTIVDSTLYNSAVTGLEPGTYIFKWTVWNSSCSASEQLIVNQNQITANAGGDIATCFDSARLGATLPPNSTGFWQVGTPGPVIDNSTLYNTLVTNLNSGNNLFTWTVSANGCSDAAYVVVTNNMVYVDAGTDQNICDNQTTLFGSNPSGGTGVWNVVSGSGDFLASTSNVTNVVNIGQGANVFSWTVTRGLCSNSDEVIINNNEVYADAGSGDDALCDTKFELNAIPAGPGETGYWTVTGGAGTIDNSTDYNTWVRNLARGENVLRWTVQTSACSNYDEIVINNITPSQAVTAPDKEICDDHTIITANEPVYGLGHWLKVSGPTNITIDESTANSTWVRNLGSGPNKFAWIIVDTATGCSTMDTIQVTNSSVTAFAGLDKETCTDTFRLEASAPSTGFGRWTKISSYGNFDDPTVNNTVVRNMGMGPNTYRWTVYSGICSASDEVIITNNTPTVADAGTDQISCDGTAVLVGSTPDLDETGLWTNISGSANIDNSTRYWTAVSGLSYGSNRFTWQITRGNCTSIDTVAVVNNNINVYAGEPQEVCTDSAYLKGNVPTYGTGVWTLSGGSGTILNSTNNETPVIGLSPGVNTFKWTITEGSCSAFDEVQITNNEPTDPTVCYDTIKICTDYTTLCANMPPDGEIGYWTLASGNGIIDDSANPNTSVSELSANSNFVWTIQKGGCTKSDTTFIVNGSVDAIVSTDTIEVCDTIGTLSANNPLEGSGYWTLVSGSGTIQNSTAYITKVTGLNEGANTFRWTVVSGSCSDYDDLVLLDNKYPVTANMTVSNPICEPEVWVVGNPPDAGAIGTWSFSAGIGQFDSIHSPATRAYNIGDGTNTIRWTVTKGSCENYAEFQVINKTINAVANSPVVVCSTTDTASLTANDPAPGTGYWQIVSGSMNIYNTTSFATKVTDVALGSNSVKWVVSNGFCSDSAFIVVQNNSFNVSAGDNFTVCDTSAVLQGSNPGSNGSGYWSIAGGHGVFENSTAYNTVVDGLNQGDNTFTWTVFRNGCSASDNVVVTNGLPTAEAGGDVTVCTDSVILSATQPPVGSGLWTQTGGRGNILNPTDYNTVVNNLGHGQNSFRWTVTNGTCTSYDDVTIYNYTILQTAGDDQNVCDTFTTLAADPPGPNGHGYWSIIGGGGNFDNSTLFNTLVTGLYDGVNTFAWTVEENGCSATNTVQIFNNRFDVNAGDDQVVTVPNATLNAQAVTGTIGTWSIAGGGGTFNDIHDPNTDVINLQYGVNTYKWSVYNPTTGCSAEDLVDITYNGFNVDAGPTQYICSDTTHLDATPVYNANTYWSIDLGSVAFEDVTDPKTKIYDIAPGQNILRWNVLKNGFSTSDTVSIYNYMFTVYAGDDQYLCDDATQLSGSGPLNTEWTDNWLGQWIVRQGGGTFSDQNDPNANIHGLASDTNYIQWTVTRTNYPGTGVCRASDTVMLIYYKMPQSDFATVGGVTQGCSPLDVSFYNTTSTDDTFPGTRYYWNFANQGDATVDYDDTVSHVFYNTSDSSVATYTVTMVAMLNTPSGQVCRDTAQHNVNVWPIPDANFVAYPLTTDLTVPNINIDNNSTQNAEVYSWNWGDSSGITQYEYVSQLSHSYKWWGDYTIRLTVTNSYGCSDIDSAVIHIIAPEPVSYGNNNVAGCSPLNLQLYHRVKYVTPGQSEFRWVITKEITGDTVDILSDPNPLYNFTDEGTYLIKLYVTAEGTNPPWAWTYIRTDTITVYPIPVADFEVSPTHILANSMINLYNNSKNAVRYLWNFGFGDNSVTDTARAPSFVYSKPGEYYISLQVWSKYGCTDRMILEEPVVVLDSGKIKFPNAFVPSTDGPSGGVVAPGDEYKNYVFRPAYYDQVSEYHLQIFNRWGELIFESYDPEIGWDGYINGVLAPQDVYVYKCRVTFNNGITRTLVGDVTLLR